jgi:hypothetical protein
LGRPDRTDIDSFVGTLTSTDGLVEGAVAAVPAWENTNVPARLVVNRWWTLPAESVRRPVVTVDQVLEPFQRTRSVTGIPDGTARRVTPFASTPVRVVVDPMAALAPIRVDIRTSTGSVLDASRSGVPA